MPSSQAQDWAGAGDAVHREPQWWLHSAGCACAWRRVVFISNARDSERVDSLVPSLLACACRGRGRARQPPGSRDTGIRALWRRFVDFGEEPPPGDVHQESALTAGRFSRLAAAARGRASNLQLALSLAPGNTPAEETYRTVHRWIDARRAKRTGDELALR